MTRLRIEIFPDDLDATSDFYTRVLGFALVRDDRGAEDEYLSLEWGDVVLGAARRRAVEHPEARRPPTGIEVVIESTRAGTTCG